MKFESLFQISGLIVGAALGAVGVGSQPARAEHTRVTNPNAVSLELLGRGLLYGISFDRVVSDDLVAGASFGRVSLNDLAGNDVNSSTTLIPVYMNYYFMREAGSAFITAGADLVLNSDEVKGRKAAYSGVEFSSTPLLPTFGVGYENRSDAGFLFRVAAYGIIGNKLAPWLGFSMGFSF